MGLFDMKEFARRGAQARIAELNEELEGIYEAFPDLQQHRRTTRPGPVDQEEGLALGAGGALQPRARKRKMTAAQRKAVSERMRKYWSARRKGSAER